MLKYLVIILDDNSVPYCHYENSNEQNKLMPLEVLKKAVLFGMKENLNIQFVYPSYSLPTEYEFVIDSVEHSDIKRVTDGKADIMILDNWSLLDKREIKPDETYLIHTNKQSFFDNYHKLKNLISKAKRVNIVISDLDKFEKKDLCNYENVLNQLSDFLEELYLKGQSPQINCLTDRMILTSMNNCNAADECITIAPDGKFYICPAFYYAKENSVGDIDSGLNIKNHNLYKLENAPICRRCDAYQCKRCIWLNKKATLEMNTPGRKQCVIAHLERNASRNLMNRLRKHGDFLPEREQIKEINYLDPFELILNNN